MDKVIKRFENIGHIKMFNTKNNDWQNYWFTSAQMLSPLLILPVPKIYNINLKDWATQNDLNHRCLKTGSIVWVLALIHVHVSPSRQFIHVHIVHFPEKGGPVLCGRQLVVCWRTYNCNLQENSGKKGMS